MASEDEEVVQTAFQQKLYTCRVRLMSKLNFLSSIKLSTITLAQQLSQAREMTGPN